MQFTQEEYLRANEVDIAQYLMNTGFALKREGNTYRGVKHDSFVVSNNHWYWNSRHLDGFPVEYLTKIEGMALPDAVHFFANGVVPVSAPKPPATAKYELKEEKKNIPFALPDANGDNKRVFAYLHRTRCIDPEIINWCIKRKLVYQSNVLNDKTGKYHQNCVFTGQLDGSPVFATERGLFDIEGQKPYRHQVDGSRDDARFVMEGCGNVLIICEAPVDCMSHATLWKQADLPWDIYTRLALCGNCDIALEGYLERNPQINKLVWAVDNDQGGRTAIRRYFQKYKAQGYISLIDLPITKDWNADLVAGIPYFSPEREIHVDEQDLENEGEEWDG